MGGRTYYALHPSGKSPDSQKSELQPSVENRPPALPKIAHMQVFKNLGFKGPWVPRWKAVSPAETTVLGLATV